MVLCSNAQKAATFGMGTGRTAYTLLTDPNIKELDIIEIEKEIINGAKFFGEKTDKVFNDPRSSIYIDDAKAFFSSTKKKYDIIVADPTYPWVSGVSGLFSTEFYRFISTHITSQGLFVQWLHLYDMNISLVASVIKALSKNFADYQVYFTNQNFIAIVAGNHKIPDKPDERIFNIPELNKEFVHIGILHPDDLYLRKLGNKNILESLFDSFHIKPNSDYFPVLDNGAVKARYLNSDAKEILSLRLSILPIIETLTGGVPLNVGSLSDRPTNEIAFSGMLARGVYEYCKSRIDTTFKPIVTLPQDIVQDLIIIQSTPEIQNFNPQEWLQSFERIMIIISPFFSPEDMKVIWSSIKIDFGKYFPQRNIDGIMLYKMIGFRDYKNIVQFIAERLEDGSISDSVNNNFILSSVMLSYIALGRKDYARMFWERYENKKNPTLQLRLLSSMLR
jgi:hypothetical protein